VAKFAKGNKAAKGGARPGSGRIPKDRAAELDLLLLIKRGAIPEDESEIPPLVLKAARTMERAMDGTDDAGNATPAAVSAAKHILEARYGKAPSTIDLNVGTEGTKIVIDWQDEGGPFGAPSSTPRSEKGSG
jgi:hypothetical protein